MARSRLLTTSALRPFQITHRPAQVSYSPSTVKPSLFNKCYRFAICGGGPAGFYAAARLLNLNGSSHILIDLFEALPTPFGLSRYGVAPDHPEVKV